MFWVGSTTAGTSIRRASPIELNGAARVEPYTRFVYPTLVRPEPGAALTTSRPSCPSGGDARAVRARHRAIAFEHLDGNCQGYALDRQVAVSLLAFARTLFHELAHAVLDHTGQLRCLDDHENTSRNLVGVEAEAVAMICGEALQLGTSDYCRGYLKHWLGEHEPILQKSAHRAFKAADRILRAARLAQEWTSKGAAKFQLGQVIITPAALEALDAEDVVAAIRGQVTGDCGELEKHDRVESELFVRPSFRVLSAYNTTRGTKFGIITQADQAVTTVLLSPEY